MTALRRAGWGLTAGLVLAAPALAQYGAHTPEQYGSTYLRAATTQQVLPPPATALPIPFGPKSVYYTPDRSKSEVVPVSQTTPVAGVTGKLAGYVLQSVDGKPVTMPVLDSHTKLEQMKVELALMADPSTFAYDLTARLSDKALLLNGYVPNDAVREKAIQIARTGTHLIIADGLRIHPSLVWRSAGVPAEKLRQDADDLLRDVFPEIAPSLEIKATITGQITLIGSARSFEEKVNASKRLRRVNGCTSVVNELKVTPILKDGRSLSMVLADGSCFVPTEIAEAAGEVPAQPTPIVHVPEQVPGKLRVSPIATAPAPPSGTASMEVPPAMRSALPPAFPSAKPSHGVSLGTVTFEDETEAKPQAKK
jgi:osmotically-inducible protein OsmY